MDSGNEVINGSAPWQSCPPQRHHGLAPLTGVNEGWGVPGPILHLAANTTAKSHWWATAASCTGGPTPAQLPSCSLMLPPQMLVGLGLLPGGSHSPRSPCGDPWVPPKESSHVFWGSPPPKDGGDGFWGCSCVPALWVLGALSTGWTLRSPQLPLSALGGPHPLRHRGSQGSCKGILVLRHN